MLKIIFMGTPSFSVPILKALDEKYDVIAVVTQPDHEMGRHHVLTPSPVKQYAVEHNIPVYQPEKIKTEYENLIALNADLIVTAAYGQFVGMKLLNAPKYRSINCHGSLLPKYRGGSPIQTAIKNGEKETGITIMYMEKQMDAGAMLGQVVVPIDIKDNNQDVFDKMSIAARDLLLEVIPKLINNEITPIPQDESLATFAYNITKEETKLDLNKPAIEVYNHIRAYNPAPLTYLQLGEDVIKVYEAELTDFTTEEKPGTILKLKKNHLYFACGNNTVIEITKLQPASKKVMTAIDFINGWLNKREIKNV